jgi:hypothetical protein
MVPLTHRLHDSSVHAENSLGVTIVPSESVTVYEYPCQQPLLPGLVT